MPTPRSAKSDNSLSAGKAIPEPKLASKFDESEKPSKSLKKKIGMKK